MLIAVLGPVEAPAQSTDLPYPKDYSRYVYDEMQGLSFISPEGDTSSMRTAGLDTKGGKLDDNGDLHFNGNVLKPIGLRTASDGTLLIKGLYETDVPLPVIKAAVTKPYYYPDSVRKSLFDSFQEKTPQGKLDFDGMIKAAATARQDLRKQKRQVSSDPALYQETKWGISFEKRMCRPNSKVRKRPERRAS